MDGEASERGGKCAGGGVPPRAGEARAKLPACRLGRGGAHKASVLRLSQSLVPEHGLDLSSNA